jgi:seryl-tRNA synthetase
MTAVLIVFAFGAVLWVHLYHQGRHAKQLLRDTETLLEVTQERGEARRARDAALDAVADMVVEIDRWRAEEAAAIGRAVLDTNTYPCRLQALQNALDEAEDEATQLRAFIAEIGLEGMGAGPDDDEPVFHGHQQYREGEDL